MMNKWVDEKVKLEIGDINRIEKYYIKVNYNNFWDFEGVYYK